MQNDSTNNTAAFALEFLKEYKIEGLALLEKHGREMANLHPLLDYRDIFHLYSNPGNNINNLNIFSPETLAQFYKTFGDEGDQNGLPVIPKTSSLSVKIKTRV